MPTVPTPTPRPDGAVSHPVPTPARPAPTPTPPPSGNRPFAAPATSRVVNVPSSIDATGSTDVGSALQSFINGQPDGSVITFPVNGVYRLSTGIRLDSRHDLILDGRGSTIRTTGPGGSALSSPFVLSSASSNTDMSIRDFVLEGNNSRTDAGHLRRRAGEREWPSSSTAVPGSSSAA